MSTEFRNDNATAFNQLGFTTTLSGITLTQTLIDTATGQTLATSYVPTSLNYITGTELNFLTGLTTFGNVAILSLTTQASRMVEIGLYPSNPNTSGVQLSTVNSSNASVFMRVLRGPSTIIGTQTISVAEPGATHFILTVPSMGAGWFDFAPLSGAATYILQGKTNGLSTQLAINAVTMFVRQI